MKIQKSFLENKEIYKKKVSFTFSLKILILETLCMILL